MVTYLKYNMGIPNNIIVIDAGFKDDHVRIVFLVIPLVVLGLFK